VSDLMFSFVLKMRLFLIYTLSPNRITVHSHPNIAVYIGKPLGLSHEIPGIDTGRPKMYCFTHQLSNTFYHVSVVARCRM